MEAPYIKLAELFNRPTNFLLERTTAATKSGLLVLFLHGYPDDMTMWAHWVPVLHAEGHDVLRVTFPGSEPDRAVAAASVQAIKQLAAVQGSSGMALVRDGLREFVARIAGDQPIVVVSHDWGCVFAFMVDAKYPNFFSRIASIDVGPSATVAAARTSCCGAAPCCCCPTKCMVAMFASTYMNMLSCVHAKICCECVASTLFCVAAGPPSSRNRSQYRERSWIYSDFRGGCLARLTCCFCPCCYVCAEALGMGCNSPGTREYDGVLYEQNLIPARHLHIYADPAVWQCNYNLRCLGMRRVFHSEFLEKKLDSQMVNVGRGNHWALPSNTLCSGNEVAPDAGILDVRSSEHKTKILDFIAGRLTPAPQKMAD